MNQRQVTQGRQTEEEEEGRVKRGRARHNAMIWRDEKDTADKPTATKPNPGGGKGRSRSQVDSAGRTICC